MPEKMSSRAGVLRMLTRLKDATEAGQATKVEAAFDELHANFPPLTGKRARHLGVTQEEPTPNEKEHLAQCSFCRILILANTTIH
jgi:hypothetical protein